jgi:hypothetical protein
VLIVGLCACVPLAGVLLGRSGGAGRRERAWELVALGIALVGIAWILVLLDTPAFRAAPG